jgi:hypothetical protein
MAHEEYDVEVDISLKDIEKTKKKARDLSNYLKEVAQREKWVKNETKKLHDALEQRLVAALKKANKEAKFAQETFGRMAKSLTRTGTAASTLGRHFLRSRRTSGHLLRNMIAIGGTYLGFRALTGAVSRLTQSLIGVNQQVENTVLSIASLYTEIEQVSFQEATRSAEGLYRQMQLLAISSPGTAQDLSGMFTMAYGPMRRAGMAMSDLLNFSRDAVAVASALRIDYAQVSRDVSMMATGAAGTDVRTFRVLRSMGMITEATEEWNRTALQTPEVIAARMQDIFQRLGEQSAEAFGRTWTGLSSAFEDIITFFSRSLSAPGFAVLRRELARVNEFLLKYRAGIDKLLTNFGGRFARVLSNMIGRMRNFFNSVTGNLERIAARIDEIIATFRRIGPILRSLVIAAAAFKAATLALGVVITAGGAIFSGLGGIVTAIAPLIGAGGLTGILGIGGTAAAGAAGAGGAAAAGTAATGGLGALIALAAPLVLLIPLLTALPGIIIGVTNGLLILGGIFIAISRNGRRLMDYFRGTGDLLLEAANNFWLALYGAYVFLAPVLQTLGFIILGVVITAIRSAAVMLVWLSRIARVVGGALAILGHMISPLTVEIRLVFNQLFTSLRNFITVIDQFVRWLPGMTGLSTPSMTPTSTGAVETGVRRMIDDFMSAMRPSRQAVTEGEGRGGGRERERRVIDARGSTVNIRQEFRQADPDRILVQMRDDLEREVMSRTSSALVPALTR